METHYIYYGELLGNDILLYETLLHYCYQLISLFFFLCYLTRLSDFTFTFHFHALEKEMATHSSVLA